jgi:hypothetical protein
MTEWCTVLLLSAVLCVPAMAQQDTAPPPCSTPEAGQFDFWVGDWELTWGDSGKGTNKVTKVLDSCVILENFDGAPSMNFRGWSVSTYDAAAGKWKQTWVDNQGSYLDFVGGFQDGKMTLSRKTTVEGKPALQRMVFYNITGNELDWNWERSLDDGKTWELRWQIHYRRK